MNNINITRLLLKIEFSIHLKSHCMLMLKAYIYGVKLQCLYLHYFLHTPKEHLRISRAKMENKKKSRKIEGSTLARRERSSTQLAPSKILSGILFIHASRGLVLIRIWEDIKGHEGRRPTRGRIEGEMRVVKGMGMSGSRK